VVTELIQSNLPLKVCLKVANTINAQIVLDEPGAESLLCDFGKRPCTRRDYSSANRFPGCAQPALGCAFSAAHVRS
jgi:hypothetical protein